MSLKCKECGSEIPAGKLYCPTCGAEVRLVPDYDSYDMHRTPVKRTAAGDSGRTEAPLEKGFRITLKAVLGVLFIAAAVAVMIYMIIAALKIRQPEAEIDYLAEARQAFADGKMDDAEKAVIKAREKSDGEDDASDLLYADILMKTDRTAEAIPILRDVLERSGNAEAYLKLIPIYIEGSDFAAVAQLLKQTDSSEVLELYSGYAAEEPELSLTSGLTYEYGTWLEIISDKGDVYYTIDGTVPDTTSIRYEGPILLQTGTVRINAVAINAYGVRSAIVSGIFKITSPAASKKTVSEQSESENEKESDDSVNEDDRSSYTYEDGGNSDAREEDGDNWGSDDSYDEDETEENGNAQDEDAGAAQDDNGNEEPETEENNTDWQELMPFDSARAE